MINKFIKNLDMLPYRCIWHKCTIISLKINKWKQRNIKIQFKNTKVWKSTCIRTTFNVKIKIMAKNAKTVKIIKIQNKCIAPVKMMHDNHLRSQNLLENTCVAGATQNKHVLKGNIQCTILATWMQFFNAPETPNEGEIVQKRRIRCSNNVFL